MGPKLTFGAATHPGNVRELNEDGFLVDPPVFLVADGMGGHRAGDVASKIVVDSLAELAGSEDIGLAQVDACIARCHARIKALNDGSGRAPGSTLAAAISVQLDGHRYWLFVNIGDSRVYMMVGGCLEQITHDHTVVQELIDAGRITAYEAAHHPDRHVITRALGIDGEAESEYSLVPVHDASTLMLCTDGVTNELHDHVIQSIMLNEKSAEDMAQQIVSEAVLRGGRDNATALVIQVEAAPVCFETVSRSELVVDTIPQVRLFG